MFCFTIRELVLLTLVVAMGVGWWVNYQQLAPLRLELDRTKRNLSWLVSHLGDKGVMVEFRDESMRFSSRDPNPWFFSPRPPPDPEVLKAIDALPLPPDSQTASPDEN